MLPRSVKIGGHRYKIETVAADKLGKDCAGDMDPDANVIRVLRGVARSRKIEILLHECLHAMLTGHEFEDEEAILVILGEGLTQFISDNTHFMTEVVNSFPDQKKVLPTA